MFTCRLILSRVPPMQYRVAIALLIASCWTTLARAQEVDFSRHVSPLLYQLGCSAGQCHGSFSGKGGTRLSLFGGSPEMDYQNIRGGFNRRSMCRNPKKVCSCSSRPAQVDHMGGTGYERGVGSTTPSKNGSPAVCFNADKEAKVLSLRVEPASVSLVKGNQGNSRSSPSSPPASTTTSPSTRSSSRSIQASPRSMPTARLPAN